MHSNLQFRSSASARAKQVLAPRRSAAHALAQGSVVAFGYPDPRERPVHARSAIKVKLTLSRVVQVALGLLLASFLTNFIVVSVRSPLAEVERQLSSFDWAKEDLDSLGGGYSIGLLSASAYGSYRSRRADRPGEVYIEIERSVPFGWWTITEYRYEEPSEK